MMAAQTSLKEGQTSLRFGQTSISSLAQGMPSFTILINSRPLTIDAAYITVANNGNKD